MKDESAGRILLEVLMQAGKEGILDVVADEIIYQLNNGSDLYEAIRSAECEWDCVLRVDR